MKTTAYIALTACMMPLMASAQADTLKNTIQRDVEVVNNYLPTITNPFKLQVEPNIDDTMSYKATFKYEVLNKVQAVKTKPDSLEAATMTFNPEDMPYNAWVKGGIGNYGNIYGQLIYNIGTNNKYHLNLDLGHHSALGKVKLEETKEKVKAPTTKTWVGADASAFFERTAVDADMKFTNNTVKYYGYHTMNDSTYYIPTVGIATKGSELYEDGIQRLTDFDLNIGLSNRLVDPRDKVTFEARAGFGIFSNKTGIHETDIRVKGLIRIPIKTNYLFDVNLKVNNNVVKAPEDYNGNLYAFGDKRKHTDVHIVPHFGIDFDHVMLRAGLNLILDFGGEEDNFYYQPDIYADFNVSDGAASLYLGFKGGYRANTFRELSKMNPWVSSDTYDRAYVNEFGQYMEMQTTQTPIHMFVGVRAKIGRVAAFDLGAEYSSFDDEVFFVNKTFTNINDTTIHNYANLFDVVTENGKVGKLKGELNITPTSKTQVLIKGSYYKWELDVLEEAWYKPKYEAGVDIRFWPVDKLQIKAGVNSTGPRYAFNPMTMSKQKLDMLLDINLGGEYHINSRWTAFLDINNIAAQDYRRWLGYSSHRVNVLGGITFKF